jgi:hypothetical protein
MLLFYYTFLSFLPSCIRLRLFPDLFRHSWLSACRVFVASVRRVDVWLFSRVLFDIGTLIGKYFGSCSASSGLYSGDDLRD